MWFKQIYLCSSKANLGIELDNGNILDTMELSLSPLTQLLHLVKSLGLVIHPNTNYEIIINLSTEYELIL